MFERCPKCGHAPLPADQSLPAACPACGVILAKVAALAAATAPMPLLPAGADAIEHGTDPGPDQEPGVHPVVFGVRLLLWIAFVAWGWSLVRDPVADGMDSFIRRPLLIFHEAGHVIFMVLGEWMAIFGGSLNQVLVPVVLAGALWWKNRDAFGASLGVWLAGVSLMDVATYVYDAWQTRLVLLGGHTGEDGPHDWVYLLRTMGLRPQAEAIGRGLHTVGALVVLLALLWGARVLWRQWHRLDWHADQNF